MTTPTPAAAMVADDPVPQAQPASGRTYALKQIVIDMNKETGRGKTHYLTVARGLTWTDAKARRNANRKARLQIVPERPR